MKKWLCHLTARIEVCRILGFYGSIAIRVGAGDDEGGKMAILP